MKLKASNLLFLTNVLWTFSKDHVVVVNASIFDSKVEPMTAADENDDEEVQLLVQYKTGEAKNHMDAMGAKMNVDIAEDHILSVKIPKSKRQELENDPDVLLVEEDQEMTSFVHTRRPPVEISEESHLRRLTETIPWGIDRVQAQDVPSLPADAPRYKVCVVDTGYGNGHQDLPTQASNGVQGFKPSGISGSWKVDGDGHGTHCAGTIGAIGGNDAGVVGVMDDPADFQFYIGKGLSDNGSGSTSTVLDAVQACVNAGAKIISMSLGGGSFSSISNNAYQRHYDDGVLIIAAAGNSGNSAKSYPASYPSIMSVAATSESNSRAIFSQYNDQVEIAAPGVGVFSTTTSNGGSSFTYASWDGTSMATPHVAGVAALIWSHFPECTNNQIRNALLVSAMDRGSSGCDTQFGYGIVQAKAAYDLLLANGCKAGGLQNEAKGGCDQIDSTIPPPADTPAPVPSPTAEPQPTAEPVGCEEAEISIVINTDDYPAETTWKLWDIYGQLVTKGGPYDAMDQFYREDICVSEGRYKFTVYDSYGDGLALGGSFKVFYNGERMMGGKGDFGERRTKSFPCIDDPNLQFNDNPARTCDWVANKPSTRCGKRWNNKKLRIICPEACGRCSR